MQSTETLQKLINDRAMAKLDKDIKENIIRFLNLISYKEFVEQFPPEKYHNWNLDSMLSFSNNTGTWIVDIIKKKKANEYIIRETALFLKEFEDVKERVGELEGQTKELFGAINY